MNMPVFQKHCLSVHPIKINTLTDMHRERQLPISTDSNLWTSMILSTRRKEKSGGERASGKMNVFRPAGEGLK